MKSLAAKTESDLFCQLLVIGYGNTLRSDDGVGPKVAEAFDQLHLPGTASLACALLTPELAEPLSRAHRAVFVDASVGAPREVQLRKLPPAPSSQVMAHSASPATLLAIARDVFDHAPNAWLLTIPAQNLQIGESLSFTTKKSMAIAIDKLQELALSPT